MRANWLVAGFVALAASASAAVAAPVDAKIVITAKAAAVGVGYTWGNGVLKYHGHSYSFTVKGVTVADLGYATITSTGRVYHLKKIADFSGNYAAATGEATLGKGLGGQVLQNGNGVQISLDETTKGARLSASADGIQLTIEK